MKQILIDNIKSESEVQSRVKKAEMMKPDKLDEILNNSINLDNLEKHLNEKFIKLENLIISFSKFKEDYWFYMNLPDEPDDRNDYWFYMNLRSSDPDDYWFYMNLRSSEPDDPDDPDDPTTPEKRNNSESLLSQARKKFRHDDKDVFIGFQNYINALIIGIQFITHKKEHILDLVKNAKKNIRPTSKSAHVKQLDYLIEMFMRVKLDVLDFTRKKQVYLPFFKVDEIKLKNDTNKFIKKYIKMIKDDCDIFIKRDDEHDKDGYFKAIAYLSTYINNFNLAKNIWDLKVSMNFGEENIYGNYQNGILYSREDVKPRHWANPPSTNIGITRKTKISRPGPPLPQNRNMTPEELRNNYNKEIDEKLKELKNKYDKDTNDLAYMPPKPEKLSGYKAILEDNYNKSKEHLELRHRWMMSRLPQQRLAVSRH